MNPYYNHDGASVVFSSTTATGRSFIAIDPHTGLQVSGLAVNDPGIGGSDPLPGGGWVRVPGSQDRARLQRSERERPQDYPMPAGEHVLEVNASTDGSQLVVWSSSSTLRRPTDTTFVMVVSLPGGHAVRWMATAGTQVSGDWLPDGSIMVRAHETAESTTLWQHLAVITSTVRGDIWLARK